MGFQNSPRVVVPNSLRQIFGPHCSTAEMDLLLERFLAYPEVQAAFAEIERKAEERVNLLLEDFEKIYPEYRAKFEEHLAIMGYSKTTE